MASKFQQHQGFGVGTVEWQQQPNQQSSERAFNRTSVLDLANQDVTDSYEFRSVPVERVEITISPEIQELMTDNAEIRQMRAELLETEAA